MEPKKWDIIIILWIFVCTSITNAESTHYTLLNMWAKRLSREAGMVIRKNLVVEKRVMTVIYRPVSSFENKEDVVLRRAVSIESIKVCDMLRHVTSKTITVTCWRSKMMPTRRAVVTTMLLSISCVFSFSWSMALISVLIQPFSNVFLLI